MKPKKKASSTRSFATLERSHDRTFIHDLPNVLAHEFGHYLVTLDFGGKAGISVWRAYGSNIQSELTVFGNCWFDYANAFERSCIGWAGEIGKSIFHDDAPNQKDLWVTMMDQLSCCEDEFSVSDLAAIRAHPDPEESLDRSLKILIELAGPLRSLVRKLAAESLLAGGDHLIYPDMDEDESSRAA